MIGQTINQSDVFEKNILYSNSLSQDCIHATEEIFKSNSQNIIDIKDDKLKLEKLQKSIQAKNEKMIEKAFNLSLNKMQPIHLNVPMEEPLYDFISKPSVKVKILKKLQKTKLHTNFNKYYGQISKASKILILIGVSDEGLLSKKSIDKINSFSSMAVLMEHTSNIHEDSFISNIDRLIGPIELKSNSDSLFEDLKPRIRRPVY